MIFINNCLTLTYYLLHKAVCNKSFKRIEYIDQYNHDMPFCGCYICYIVSNITFFTIRRLSIVMDDE